MSASLEHSLKRLRSKPEHERRRLLRIATGGIGFVVFLFWLAAFSASIEEAARAADERYNPAVPGPLDSLSGALGSVDTGWSRLQQDVQQHAPLLSSTSSPEGSLTMPTATGTDPSVQDVRLDRILTELASSAPPTTSSATTTSTAGVTSTDYPPTTP